MRQVTLESCALDGEGYAHKKRVPEYMRVEVGVANRTWPIQDIERNGESKIMRV